MAMNVICFFNIHIKSYNTLAFPGYLENRSLLLTFKSFLFFLTIPGVQWPFKFCSRNYNQFIYRLCSASNVRMLIAPAWT